jgi:hypothetical protein
MRESGGRPRARYAERCAGAVQPAAYSPAGLLLFVDSVNAPIGAFEMAKRVPHLLDARDVPEKLASCAGELERGGFEPSPRLC